MRPSAVHAGSVPRPGTTHSFIERKDSHIDGITHGEYLHFPHLGHRYEKWFSAYSFTMTVFVWQSRHIGGSGSVFNCAISTSGYTVTAFTEALAGPAILHTESVQLGFIEHSKNTVFKNHFLTGMLPRFSYSFSAKFCSNSFPCSMSSGIGQRGYIS